MTHEPDGGSTMEGPSEPVTASSTVSASDGLLHSEMDGTVVIFDSTSGTYYTLNEVGGFILDALRTPTAVSAVVTAVTRRFDVTAEECVADVLELLNQLLKIGLIRLEPASPVGDA